MSTSPLCPLTTHPCVQTCSLKIDLHTKLPLLTEHLDSFIPAHLLCPYCSVMTGCLFQAACPLALGETRAAQGPAQRCPAVPRGPSGADPSPVASTAPAVWPCTALASSARSWSSPPAWRSSQSHLPQVSCRPRARRGPDAPVCYRGGCSGFAGAASVFDSCQSVLIGQFVFNDPCQPVPTCWHAVSFVKELDLAVCQMWGTEEKKNTQAVLAAGMPGGHLLNRLCSSGFTYEAPQCSGGNPKSQE